MLRTTVCPQVSQHGVSDVTSSLPQHDTPTAVARSVARPSAINVLVAG